MTARAVVLAAAMASGASSAAAQQPGAEVLLDRDLTVGAGATISATIGGLVARGEDAAVPNRLFAEDGASRRTANVTYRLVKHLLFDAPQEQLLLVFDHELFGHGARLRERFDGPIGYTIRPPSPYGSGAGSTSFVFERQPTVYELMAVRTGGMESTGVVASIVAEQAFVNGRMRSRDALRYLIFEFDTLRYIASTDDDGEEPGHDVGDFLHTYNDLAAAADARTLTPGRLQRQALISLANPVAAYAAFGVARYWWTGTPDVPVPAISIAGVRYLPLVRYRLTPYGTEWALVNSLAGRLRPTEIELRVGQSPRVTPWGVGVRQRGVVRAGRWSVDAAVDVWSQPPIADSAVAGLTFDPRIGTRVRARVNHAFTSRSTFIIEIGAKRGGYVPGEPLRGGVVARAGIGLPMP